MDSQIATAEHVVIANANPRLFNLDLLPTAPAARTWSTYNYVALWFSMSMEVTTYMLARA